MRFFPCGARLRFLPARSTSSRAQVPAPPVLSPITRQSDRQWMAARGEGVSARWSQSRSTADSGAWRTGAHDGVPRDFDRLRTATRGGPGGFCRDRWSIYDAKKSPDRAGDRETPAIGHLPSHPRLGNYAKFALSFAKLSKMQTPNAKLLDTSFCDFWQITRMQTSNAKPLDMLLVHPQNQKLFKVFRHIESCGTCMNY